VQAVVPPPPLNLADQGAALLPDFAGDLGSADRWDRYSISVSLDPKGLRASGSMRLDVTNRTGAPLAELYFHLYPNHSDFGGGLRVDDVRVDGQPVDASVSAGNVVLKVPLVQPLAPGASTSVTMGFVARSQRNASASAYGAFNQEAGVWALATFYPVLVPFKDGGWLLGPISSRGDIAVTDTALYEVRVDAPDGWDLATTGARVSVEPGEAGRRTERFVSGPQRDFLLTALQGLEQAIGSVGGTRIVVHYQAGNAAAGARALETAEQSLRIYNDRFGRYPLAELDIVQAALTNFLGVEYPGIVLIEQRLYRGGGGLVTTVAHEVAHQWWYSQVGSDSQARPWIDEGLASYAQIVYREGIGDGPGAEAELQDFRDTLLRARAAGRDGVSARPSAAFQGNYLALVYAKPALFLQALRQQLGDDTFFRGLQGYYAAMRYGDDASGVNLVAGFQDACGCQIQDLFDAWITSDQQVPLP
jgi:hypothetical protein